MTLPRCSSGSQLTPSLHRAAAEMFPVHRGGGDGAEGGGGVGAAVEERKRPAREALSAQGDPICRCSVDQLPLFRRSRDLMSRVFSSRGPCDRKKKRKILFLPSCHHVLPSCPPSLSTLSLFFFWPAVGVWRRGRHKSADSRATASATFRRPLCCISALPVVGIVGC